MPRGKQNVSPNVQKEPTAPVVELTSTSDVSLAQEKLPLQESAEQTNVSSGQSDSASTGKHDGTTEVSTVNALDLALSSHAVADAILASADPDMVAEVEATISDFQDWAKSSEPVEDLSEFVKCNLLNEDHSLTDLGCVSLDNVGIPYRTINFLTLGIPVTYKVNGQNVTVQAGSTLRVLHGGRDNDNQVYYVVDGGERLPNAQIYAHSQHKFHDARYPATQPLGSKYEVAT